MFRTYCTFVFKFFKSTRRFETTGEKCNCFKMRVMYFHFMHIFRHYMNKGNDNVAHQKRTTTHGYLNRQISATATCMNILNIRVLFCQHQLIETYLRECWMHLKHLLASEHQNLICIKSDTKGNANGKMNVDDIDKYAAS